MLRDMDYICGSKASLDYRMDSFCEACYSEVAINREVVS